MHRDDAHEDHTKTESISISLYTLEVEAATRDINGSFPHTPWQLWLQPD